MGMALQNPAVAHPDQKALVIIPSDAKRAIGDGDCKSGVPGTFSRCYGVMRAAAVDAGVFEVGHHLLRPLFCAPSRGLHTRFAGLRNEMRFPLGFDFN